MWDVATIVTVVGLLAGLIKVAVDVGRIRGLLEAEMHHLTRNQQEQAKWLRSHSQRIAAHDRTLAQHATLLQTHGSS